MIFLKGITDKNRKRINYRIKEWHTSTPYDILRNQSTYPTVCLLLDTWHRTDHCIAVCGKCIFDSNIKLVLPLTQVCLNYICCGNDTDENKLDWLAVQQRKHEFFLILYDSINDMKHC